LGPGAPGAAAHAASGLTRDGGALGHGWDPSEPGDGVFRLGDGQLEARADWHPPRPVLAQGDSATLRLGFDPRGDTVVALQALFAPASLVDRERLAATTAPSGWSTRYALGPQPTEDDVLANVELCLRHFDRRQLRLIRVDDGYQRAAGDWDTNDRFPRGHRALTDRIHARGLQAGLWLAPFVVAQGSGIPATHPDWLLRRDGAPLVVGRRDAWGGDLHALDGAHPGVQEWLFALARRVVRDWGYDVLEAGGLRWAARDDGGEHFGGLTRAEAYRRGLAALRDGLGADTFFAAADAPLQHAAGLVNAMRVGPDVDPTPRGTQPAARAAALRAFYHRGSWLNDPDCLVVRAPLDAAEARAWASVIALSGGAAVLSDDLRALAPERLAIAQRALPAAAVAGRPLDAMQPDRDVAPAVVAGERVHAVTGSWHFRTGDDPAYAAAAFDDSVWETIPVPGPWELAGRPDYDGFAWYRVRFHLPPAGSSNDQATLELGKVAEADETFLNGARVGQTGDFPPTFRGEPAGYRRYAVPAGALNWGGDNVLAVRVYEAGAARGGGLWNARRERPAGLWITAGRDDWWTVALLNWDDEPRRLELTLDAAGLPRGRYQVYDVWNDRPLPDVTTSVTAELGARDALVAALRPAAPRPQVIGTTRHIVQGAVDLLEDSWDAATATLRGRSGSLDHRAYAVTVAVPRALVAARCDSDVPCTMRSLPGHVVLEWPAAETLQEIAWSVRFRAARAAAPR
jgi:hypothetical protein